MLKSKLFAVGDLGLDILYSGGRVRMGEEHSLSSLNLSIGGNAANFSVVAAKIGLNPALFSVIGGDFATPFLLKELRSEKLALNLIYSKKPNAYSLIQVKGKDRAIQSIKSCLSEMTVKGIEKKLLAAVQSQDIVFFGGFFHLKNFAKGFKGLLRRIKRKQGLVCFDTCFDTFGKWGIKSYLPFIDFLFTNETELSHIARGKTRQQRINFLLRKGVGVVVLKQGAKGATLFRKGLCVKAGAVKGKVVDTTGAGDAFNAGFVFGLMHDYNFHNCLLAGNFVASKKIQRHGLAAPSAKAVERHVAVNNNPLVVVESNYEKMSSTLASIAIELLRQKPDASIALPTGGTPKKFYKILVSEYKKGRIDFSRTKFFAVDEYVGLSQDDKNSFSYYLRKNFLQKVNARKKNIFLLDGTAKNRTRVCAKHEAVIRRHGIDLAVLGIGRNGHIAFNEPGSCSYSVTRTIKLKPQTRKVNGKSFEGGLAPAKAITIGLRTIRENSRQIVLVANGAHKAGAIARAMKSRDFLKCPAVTLQWHKNVVFLLDRQAAAKL